MEYEPLTEAQISHLAFVKERLRCALINCGIDTDGAVHWVDYARRIRSLAGSTEPEEEYTPPPGSGKAFLSAVAEEAAEIKEEQRGALNTVGALVSPPVSVAETVPWIEYADYLRKIGEALGRWSLRVWFPKPSGGGGGGIVWSGGTAQIVYDYRDERYRPATPDNPDWESGFTFRNGSGSYPCTGNTAYLVASGGMDITSSGGVIHSTGESSTSGTYSATAMLRGDPVNGQRWTVYIGAAAYDCGPCAESDGKVSPPQSFSSSWSYTSGGIQYFGSVNISVSVTPAQQ